MTYNSFFNITFKIRSVTYNGTTTSYKYDDWGRLIEESTSGNTILYSYDENNKLIINNGKSLVYDSSCPFKLIKAGTFDSNGNQLTGHEYTYIGRNISSIRIVETNILLQFAYDYKGRRIQKNDIQYIYFNDKLESEIHTSYTLKFMYDENNDLYGFYYNDIPYFYLKNALGTIYAVIDQNGNKVVQYTYNAWGKIESISSTNSIIANINPFIYKSYYYDKETQLFYCNSRYYSLELCRWISPDSIEYLDPESINGLNLYAYCNNDPVNKYDPTGHIAISLIVGLVVSFAIGTTASAISQYAQYGDVNWLQAGVDGLFAVASTALAYTGIGLIGSIAAGAGMGLAQYTLDSAVFHDDFSWSGALIATGLGALGGLASGRGAQHFKSIGSNLDDTGRTGIKAILTAFDKYGTGAGYQKVMNLW
ncbi:MAG: RHS repeat-associated core domain-containing protein, partial [Bacilli bacterium]|nr:RHS repeat-associated core domain-containing protein [Bacilli bacterium]